MAPPSHFLNTPRAFPQDMKSHLFFRCNGGTAKKICRAQEFDGLLIMVMVVVCLSFLSIFMVPIGLQRKLGLEAAREAMDSVGFAVFVVMDSVSFFSSMAVVMVLLQAIDMHNSSESGMMRMCGIAAQIALGDSCKILHGIRARLLERRSIRQLFVKIVIIMEEDVNLFF